MSINLKNTPKISVIMPVYNTEKYVWQAIESILSQSFDDFEFIIIDDCSTDTSYQICQSCAKKDTRIKLSQNQGNIGVVKTRNRLLGLVDEWSQYIAIMDADDISDPSRIQLQHDYLQEHKNISIVGSNISIIDDNSLVTWKRIYPQTQDEISKSIFIRSPFAQPSVMIRKSDLEKVWVYNEDFERCQDYELWCRFFDMWYMWANINQELLRYRVFSDQWKSKHLKLTLKNTIKVQKKYIFQRQYLSIKNICYILAENILLLFPNTFILLLFKKLSYKNVK